MTYVLLAIVVYILYRFIFGFVVPVLTMSRKMQQGMRDLHSNMHGRPPAEDVNVNQRSNSTSGRKNAQPSSKDYIDFEEVK